MMNAQSRYQLLDRGVWDYQERVIVTPDVTPTAWQQYLQWLSAGGVPLPADPIGQEDLQTAQSARIADINAYAAALRNAAVVGRSAGEMASWAVKLNEARSYVATHDASQAPTLAATAEIRCVSIKALVQSVLDAAQPFLRLEAWVDGIRGKHCDAVQVMTDVREVVAYDWRSGWPTIPV